MKEEKTEVNVEMHPTLIFARKVTRDKTEGGIFIPEASQDKDPTPIVEVLKVGSDVSWTKEGDVVYINPAYMNFATLDGVTGVVLFQDAIIAKVNAV